MAFYLRSKSLLIGLLFLGVFACQSNSKKEDAAINPAQEYVMYQPSEMAILMQDFYEYNQQLKEDILQGHDLTVMPEEFKAIHTAKMTDSTGRNTIFNGYAPAYIKLQTAVTDSNSSLDLKTKYNNAINVCLACHKTECVGPIPRIKKLLIQ